MPRPHDPVTLANEAMSALLQADPFLTSLNWKPWENNQDAENLPRGYVQTRARTAILNAGDGSTIGNEMMFEFEVVIEAQPKVDLDKEQLASIMGHLVRPDLKTALNALIPDGSLTFNTRPEGFGGSQELSGNTRVYKMMTTMYASWNVQWVPDV